jgi:hypothetical protein
VFKLLFVLPYLKQLTPSQRAVLACCCLLAAPLVKALVRLVDEDKVPAPLSHPTLYLHSWSHLPAEVRKLLCPALALILS